MCQELSLRMLGRPKGVRGYHCQSTYSNLSIPWWFALIPGTIGYSLPHSHGRKNMVVNRGDWHVRQSISTIPLPYPYHTIPILEPTYNPMNWKMYIYNTYITHTHTHIYIYIYTYYIYTHWGCQLHAQSIVIFGLGAHHWRCPAQGPSQAAGVHSRAPQRPSPCPQELPSRIPAPGCGKRRDSPVTSEYGQYEHVAAFIQPVYTYIQIYIYTYIYIHIYIYNACDQHADTGYIYIHVQINISLFWNWDTCFVCVNVFMCA